LLLTFRGHTLFASEVVFQTLQSNPMVAMAQVFQQVVDELYFVHEVVLNLISKVKFQGQIK